MVTLLFVIGIILLMAIIIIPTILIGGGTLIFAFGDFIIAIFCIALIAKIIKHIRNKK